MTAQAPSSVVLVRPHHFAPNPQTKTDNAYQSWHMGSGADVNVAQASYHASTQVAGRLEEAGVAVHIFDDIGTRIALVGLEAIIEPTRRRDIVDRLEHSGRQVIPLTHAQLTEFAGNAIELRGGEGSRLLAMSARRYE